MKKKKCFIITVAIVLGIVCFTPIKQIECSKKVLINTKTTRNLNSSELETIKKGLYNSINSYRKSQKKKTLVKTTTLEKSAGTRSKEIVKKWSHTRPNGKTWVTVLTNYGISKKSLKAGENLAKVTFSAKKSYNKDYLNRAVQGMMKKLKSSQTHRNVMLNNVYSKYGIGITVKKSGNTITVYSVQHYSSK